MDRETTLNRWLDRLEEKLKENTVEKKMKKEEIGKDNSLWGKGLFQN